MNIFAILNHMGVFFKEEPVRQLHAALEKAGYAPHAGTKLPPYMTGLPQ